MQPRFGDFVEGMSACFGFLIILMIVIALDVITTVPDDIDVVIPCKAEARMVHSDHLILDRGIFIVSNGIVNHDAYYYPAETLLDRLNGRGERKLNSAIDNAIRLFCKYN